MNIAKTLRDLRIDHDLTQQQLADLFHVERKTILRIENELFMPKVEVLITYSRFFNISLDYICGLIDTPRTLDGSPYQIKNHINIGNISGGNNKFDIH